jgi:ankyrin repeat protein
VVAFRLNLPWSVVEIFLPETLPHDWLFRDGKHPFGEKSISKEQFLVALESNLPEDNPNLVLVKQARKLFLVTVEDEERDFIDQAQHFTSYWDSVCSSVKHNRIPELMEELRVMVQIMNYPRALAEVRNHLGQQNYSREEFAGQLWKLMKSCTTAEVFLAIATVCERYDSSLLGFETDDGSKNKAATSACKDSGRFDPLFMKWGLLDELLAIPNVPLIKELMTGVEKRSEFYFVSCCTRMALFECPAKAFSTLMRSPHVTAEFLNHAAQCCEEMNRADIIDKEVDPQNKKPLGLAWELGRLDFFKILLRYTNVLFIDDADCHSYPILAFFLCCSGSLRPVLTREEFMSIVQLVIDQATRVFQNKCVRYRQLYHTEFCTIGQYMDSTGPNGRTPFEMAYLNDDTVLMELLSRAGASPFGNVSVGAERNNIKSSFCHQLITDNQLAELERILTISKNCIPYSDGYIPGIDSYVDKQGLTALQLASTLENLAAVKMLIQFGASLLPFSPSSAFVKALIKRKESPGKKADALVKALFTGWSAQHTVALLSLEAVEQHPLLISFMKSQVSAVVKPYLKKESDRLTLMQGGVEALKYSSALFDLVLENSQKQPAAGVKVHNVLDILTVEHLQRLIKAGLDLNVRSDGLRVHFKAVQAANMPVLCMLIDAGGLDLQEKDMEGNTLLHWAVLKTVSSVLYLAFKKVNK